MTEDEYVDKLGDMAEALCELASTDIQMAVEPAHRLDWHTLRTVAGMLDKLAEGTSAADIMNTWIGEYTPGDKAEGDQDYEVTVVLPLSFEDPTGLIKNSIWQKLNDAYGASTGFAGGRDHFGVFLRVPAGTTMHTVRSKAILMVVTAAREVGHPLKDLPFADEIFPMS